MISKIMLNKVNRAFFDHDENMVKKDPDWIMPNVVEPSTKRIR
jgi:hypothetical protein